MSKVEFTHANGKVELMSRRYAEVLAKLGRGSYLTRDMRAQPPVFVAPVVQTVPAEVPAEESTSASTTESDGLDDMSPDELRELAKSRGIQVHHRAGADKIRAALRGE